MDLKRQGFTFLLTMLLSMMGVEAFAHDIEVANTDGVTIYYNYINNSTELAVSYRGNFDFSYADEYTGDVVIPSTVTYNGTTYPVTSINDAFSGCSSLASVTIPYSVTSIGASAFYNCSDLMSIDIPNSVTSIGGGAFRGCKSLTSIDIPNSVTSIGNGAFSGCSGLTNINIPNSVTSIEEYAFSNCSGLTSITVDKSNTVYDSRDNCNAIIETSSNTLIIGCKDTAIPNTVTRIGTKAFSGCRRLTSLTIPNSVTSIEDYAFLGCSDLTSVTIPNSVISIGENAFYSCSGLTSVTIPNSVTSIGRFAFADCSGLTSITIPNSVTSIGLDAFQNCSSLTSVTIPNSVTSIEGGAFSNCSSLTSVTIPNSVTSIGNGAFSGCSSLTSVTIPNSVITIERSAFWGCSGLTSVTIPNSVTSIGLLAFECCSDLTNITIPSSVTSIGHYAFSNTAWYNNQPDGVVYAGKVAYAYKGTMPSNTSIVLKEGTLGIAGMAFSDCHDLTSITIPYSVTNIGEYAFSHCWRLTSITIPNSVTSIGEYAFYDCSPMTSVTIGNSVTTIGWRAFACGNCLTSVTMESMTPIEIIEGTFSNSANVTLYVPYGSKSAYQEADVWKDFKEIEELEPDYNLSNKLVVSDVSVVQGGTVALPIAMENEDEITAFQFELELPNGMTVSEATLTSRKSNQTLTYNLLNNGRYQFVAFSSNSQAFSGNEGALVNVLLKAGGTMTAGEYTIEVKNIELTTTSEQACKPANCSATLTVNNIKVGDANGDGNISITDAVAVVNYLLNRPSASFRADAADLTGDGNITITDAVAIVNIVLGKRQANARMREPQ